MHQKQGVFSLHWIKIISESEVERFEAYLTKYWTRMTEMWAPISPQTIWKSKWLK